jgi:hypothetical protein
MENNVECIHLQYLEAADRVKNPNLGPQPHYASGFSTAEGQSAEWKCCSFSAESGQLTLNSSLMFATLQALWHAFPKEQGEIPPGVYSIAVHSAMAKDISSVMSWGTCFWLAPLAREIGLIVMSWGSRYWWIIWPGNSFDPKPSSTVSKLNGRHWVPSSCELVIILLQYPRWTFWDHFGWSWNRMLFLIISKKGIKIH